MDTGTASTCASFRSMIPDIRSRPGDELDDVDKTWNVSSSVTLNIVPIPPAFVVGLTDGEQFLPNSLLNKLQQLYRLFLPSLHCQMGDDIVADDQASC